MYKIFSWLHLIYNAFDGEKLPALINSVVLQGKYSINL